MRAVLQKILVSLLLTGMSCIEYHRQSAAEYLFLLEVLDYQPMLTYMSAENAFMKHDIRITSSGENGLFFEILPSYTKPGFTIDNRAYFLSSFEFKFEPGETLLEIEFEDEMKSLIAETKVFSWPETEELQEHANANAVDVTPYLTTGQIGELINMGSSEEKYVTFSLAWLDYFLQEAQPIFSDMNTNPGAIVYICKPIVMDPDIYEELRLLNEHMTAYEKQ